MPSFSTLSPAALRAALLIAAASFAACASRSAPVVTLPVEGMACPNCAAHIAEELRAVPGVRDATVDFASKTATVSLSAPDSATRAELEAAVQHWKDEHFAAEEDPECLDPARRAEIKAAQGSKSS